MNEDLKSTLKWLGLIVAVVIMLPLYVLKEFIKSA